MNIHDATEQAYKNGYAKGFADGKVEVAREIFEEVERVVNFALCVDIADWSAYTELKKKYTEGETC